MNDESPEMANEFDTRFLQRGKHSAILYIPDDYLAPIGSIIAHWGLFEVAFNAQLRALIEGENADGGSRDTTGWETLPFKRRRQLFQKICREWLNEWAHDETRMFEAICNTAGDLAWKRNIIAHGAYAVSLPPHSNKATNCRAEDLRTGDVFPFDKMVLKKIYHEISHLTAELLLAGKTIGEVKNAPVTLPDEQILRAYRETTHPWTPNPNKRTPPPESSPQ